MNDANILKDEVDLRNLAKNALNPIEKKLQGIYTSGEGREGWQAEKAMTTSNLVDALIQEATSNKNLVSATNPINLKDPAHNIPRQECILVGALNCSCHWC